MTAVNQFLHSECIFSQFETDYISFEELKVAYMAFCKKIGIPESKREQIIGSDEMIAMGTSIKNMDPPRRLVGVKKVIDSKNPVGLIRRKAGT